MYVATYGIGSLILGKSNGNYYKYPKLNPYQGNFNMTLKEV
jgi:hypothetical protein